MSYNFPLHYKNQVYTYHAYFNNIIQLMSSNFKSFYVNFLMHIFYLLNHFLQYKKRAVSLFFILQIYIRIFHRMLLLHYFSHYNLDIFYHVYQFLELRHNVHKHLLFYELLFHIYHKDVFQKFLYIYFYL